MSAPFLHRYIYFYQSENALAFAATTSGSALVIDRATAGISLQRANPLKPKLTCSPEHDFVPASTDNLWDHWDH